MEALDLLKVLGPYVTAAIVAMGTVVAATINTRAKLKSEQDANQNELLQEHTSMLEANKEMYNNMIGGLGQLSGDLQDFKKEVNQEFALINKVLAEFIEDKRVKTEKQKLKNALESLALEAISEFDAQDSLSSMILVGTQLASDLFASIMHEGIDNYNRAIFTKRSYMVLKSLRNQFTNSLPADFLEELKTKVVLKQQQELVDKLSAALAKSKQEGTTDLQTLFLEFTQKFISNTITLKREYDAAKRHNKRD